MTMDFEIKILIVSEKNYNLGQDLGSTNSGEKLNWQIFSSLINCKFQSPPKIVYAIEIE